MFKIKYTTRENTKVGTHSFYAVPVPTGLLEFRDLCEEACEDSEWKRGADHPEGDQANHSQCAVRQPCRS